jgi:hypothetical protein
VRFKGQAARLRRSQTVATSSDAIPTALVPTRSPSLPGLTRQSILLNESLFPMDARVKPAHDELRTTAADN